jgi:toxin-antitoxin system PIN domain toxin
MTCFPDVNVWLALAVIEHVHHAAAAAWYESGSCEKIAFSRITQMGFLRLLTNNKALGSDALTVVEAWKKFDLWRGAERVTYATEPDGLEREWRNLSTTPGHGANFWTDAYLVAFAARSGFTLVTFDRQLSRTKGVAVELLGA